jgi:hypothetical protein
MPAIKRGDGWASQVPIGVHAFVQDSHNSDTAFISLIEDDVARVLETEIAFAKRFDWTSQPWILGKPAEAVV